MDNRNPQQPGAVENQDYSLNTAQNPAARGGVILIYATGYGPLDSSGQAPVQVYFGDTPAQILYSARHPSKPGLWQINAQVPAGVPPGVNRVFLIAAGMPSNAVTVGVN